MNDASFAAELQRVSLNEAQEILEDTEAAFMKIESNPDDAKTIDKIFRLVHPIKGSAQVAGFVELGNFTHTFENLLGLIRDRKLAVTADVADNLLAGNDSLRLFVAELKKSANADVNCDQVSQRIEHAITAEVVDKAKPVRNVETSAN